MRIDRQEVWGRVNLYEKVDFCPEGDGKALENFKKGSAMMRYVSCFGKLTPYVLPTQRQAGSWEAVSDPGTRWEQVQNRETESGRVLKTCHWLGY